MSEYTSVLKSSSYLYLELKKACNLKIQGLDENEIRNKAIEENIFALSTETRKKGIASAIVSRIKILDDYVIDKIANGNLQTSKQLALYSILKTDRLCFEFMQEVYREKILLRDYKLTDKDFNVFFRRKSEQSEKIANWVDYTYYKLGQVYKRILTEAGFIKTVNKEIEIVPQIMEDDVINHLQSVGDTIYIEAMLGEV